MTVHCAQCGHTWNCPMKVPIPIVRAVAAMRGFVAAGCPRCGAHGKNVLCGPNLSGNKKARDVSASAGPR